MHNSDGDKLHRDDETASDRVLLSRFRGGEQEAAKALYERYAHRLEALVASQTAADLKTRFDAEDVVQSVFRTLFRRVGSGLYDVPPGDELWQLLLVLALNKTRKLATYHRAQKRDVSKTRGADGLDQAVSLHDRGDQTALRALEMIVEELLCEMPAAHQRIVQMRIEGFRAADISEQTQRSKRTVERVLQDFRRQLSALIDGSTGQPHEEPPFHSTQPR